MLRHNNYLTICSGNITKPLKLRSLHNTFSKFATVLLDPLQESNQRPLTFWTTPLFQNMSIYCTVQLSDLNFRNGYFYLSLFNLNWETINCISDQTVVVFQKVSYNFKL